MRPFHFWKAGWVFLAMKRDPLEKFAELIQLDETTGCWNWLGRKTETGYGKLWADDQMWMAHRFSYAALIGPLPDGLESHHKCRNRGCVNPWHLELVTHQKNCETDFTVTHCKNGHAYKDGEYYEIRNKDGHVKRTCKICAKERAHAYHEQHRAEQNAKNMARYYANHELNKAAQRDRYHNKKLT